MYLFFIVRNFEILVFVFFVVLANVDFFFELFISWNIEKETNKKSQVIYFRKKERKSSVFNFCFRLLHALSIPNYLRELVIYKSTILFLFLFCWCYCCITFCYSSMLYLFFCALAVLLFYHLFLFVLLVISIFVQKTEERKNNRLNVALLRCVWYFWVCLNYWKKFSRASRVPFFYDMNSHILLENTSYSTIINLSFYTSPQRHKI